MRGFAFGALCVVLAEALAAGGCVWFGLVPINADAKPAALERWAARAAVIAGVERRMQRREPGAITQAALFDGMRVYEQDCQFCHGDARGNVSLAAEGLYQTPPRFAKTTVDQIPFAYNTWVVAHGIRLTGMPAFQDRLSRDQMTHVVQFIQRIPHLTGAQRFAWTGAPPRQALSSALHAIGGTRACTYLPDPHARPHHFYSDVSATPDGAFIVERVFNQGIAEVAVIGYDASHRRYVRTKIAKDGAADIATSSGESNGVWTWRGNAVTTIVPERGGSYVFRQSDMPGSGRCNPSLSTGRSR